MKKVKKKRGYFEIEIRNNPLNAHLPKITAFDIVKFRTCRFFWKIRKIFVIDGLELLYENKDLESREL